MIRTSSFVVALVGLVGLAAQPAMSANVKVTPLGSIDGEFCLLDRAMVFEDPDGTRILYDAGITVRGPDDPRLGKIDGVLAGRFRIKGFVGIPNGGDLQINEIGEGKKQQNGCVHPQEVKPEIKTRHSPKISLEPDAHLRTSV